jgi:hypothetical protein
MQSDNLSSHIGRVNLTQKVSSKTNNPYTVLELEWILPNDKTYKQTVFVNDEQKSLIEQSVSINRT